MVKFLFFRTLTIWPFFICRQTWLREKLKIKVYSVCVLHLSLNLYDWSCLLDNSTTYTGEKIWAFSKHLNTHISHMDDYTQTNTCFKSKTLQNATLTHVMYTYTHLVCWESFSTSAINTCYENNIGLFLKWWKVKRKSINSSICRDTFIKLVLPPLLEWSMQRVWAAHAIIKTCFCKQPSILTDGLAARCWISSMDLPQKPRSLPGHSLWSQEGDNYWWPLLITN